MTVEFAFEVKELLGPPKKIYSRPRKKGKLSLEASEYPKYDGSICQGRKQIAGVISPGVPIWQMQGVPPTRVCGQPATSRRNFLDSLPNGRHPNPLLHLVLPS